MPIPPPNGTYSIPELGIGNSESLIQSALFVGDSFLGRSVAWEGQDPDDCDLVIPFPFDGFTPVAEVLDVNGVVLETMSVTPPEGDVTGSFLVELSSAQTTLALSEAAVSWRFRVTSPAPSQDTLLIAPFNLRVS